MFVARHSAFSGPLRLTLRKNFCDFLDRVDYSRSRSRGFQLAFRISVLTLPQRSPRPQRTNQNDSASSAVIAAKEFLRFFDRVEHAHSRARGFQLAFRISVLTLPQRSPRSQRTNQNNSAFSACSAVNAAKEFLRPSELCSNSCSSLRHRVASRSCRGS